MKITSDQLFYKLQKPPYNLKKFQIYEFLSFLLSIPYYDLIGNLHIYIIDNPNLEVMLDQIANSYPIPYIINSKNFHGENFYVDERVLIPRDETSLLVEFACEWLKKSNKKDLTILDLCSGSGICGLTIKKNIPKSKVYLSDISNDAIDVSKINAQKLNLEVNYLIGNFLKPSIDQKLSYDLIICNPPYIFKGDLNRSISTYYEPEIALIADENGYFFYRIFFQEIQNLIKDMNNFCIILECGLNQKKIIEEFIEKSKLKMCKIKFFNDWSGHERGVCITNEGNDAKKTTNKYGYWKIKK